MSRLQRGILNTTHDRVLDATVIDVVRDRCSVRLTENGQALHGLKYSGGPLTAGDRCKVTYASGAPMALGMGRSSASEIQRRPVRTRMVIPDYRPSDLGGWVVPPHTHGGSGGGDLVPSIVLFKFATLEYAYFDATEDGLIAAVDESTTFDSIGLPEVDIYLTARLTFKANTDIYGKSPWATRLYGPIGLGDGGGIYNMSVWNFGTDNANPIITVVGPPNTGAKIWNCSIRADNDGSGGTVCVQNQGTAWVGCDETYFRSVSAGGDAIIFQNSVVSAVRCTLAADVDLDAVTPGNFAISDNCTVASGGTVWQTTYSYIPDIILTGDFAPVNHTHDDRYYTETELQTSGQAQVHWENVTNQPKFQAIFTVERTLEVVSGEVRIGNHTGRTLTISAVYLDVSTAPASQAIIVDIHKNGTTIFTNQVNRPQIAAGANTGNTTTIDAPSWANGDYLTMDIDQVGVGTAGENLTATVVYS